MIWNIIDRRDRPYRWKTVTAIIEAVEHDNSCADADQAPEASPMDVIDYDRREDVSVVDALAWANAQRCPVTLFLYDTGKGTTIEEHFEASECRF
jgi:hypothetical protein